MVTNTAMMPFNSHLRKLIQTGTHSIHFESIWLCKRPPELKLKSSALNSDQAKPNNTSGEMVSCRRSGFSVLFSFLIKLESYNSVKTNKQKSTVTTKRWWKRTKKFSSVMVPVKHPLFFCGIGFPFLQRNPVNRFTHIPLALKCLKIQNISC